MSALAILGVIGGSSVALLSLAALIRGTWRITRRIVYIADTVAELTPNGGSSIKDQIGRIERQLADHIAEHEKAGQHGES